MAFHDRVSRVCPKYKVVDTCVLASGEEERGHQLEKVTCPQGRER